ncbi:MAG: helix-turn-helix transcriptional regulator [Desulfuromusa sp.]|jgi:transcriptional regulator with XRE-family HTH domain|nr:helix-turn-helix transcriptional regulator [Desulfuromusa sp.]
MLFKIGEYIRLERKQRKMSQSALAKLLGMSRSTISQIETGTVQDIGVRKLIRILEVLDFELRVRPAGSPPTLDELREDDDLL